MKTFIILTIILSFFIDAAVGQTGIKKVARGYINKTNRPLVLIDTFQTDMQYLFINTNNIEAVDVFKDSTAIAKFGQGGKYGVIVIHPKDHTGFFQIDHILDKYSIAKQDRKLRICINKTLIKEPQLLLIEKSELLNVEITTERHWINAEDANTGEKFINIITQTKDKNGFY